MPSGRWRAHVASSEWRGRLIPRRVPATNPHGRGAFERQLRARLDALGPTPRAELLHVLMLPTSSEPTIGEVGATRRTATIVEPLIDCEEDRTLQAVLVGLLREGN